MEDFIRPAIQLILANYPLSFLVIGFLVSIAAIARSPEPVVRGLVVEKLLCWFVFFSVGVYNLYNFVMHVFFGALSASFIGWADSPFQLEVGVASLGFAAVGFLAAFRSFDLRLAAILGPSIFTLGAAIGHLREMVTAHDFAPGNAGVMFYADIFVPILGFCLLWSSRSHPVHRVLQTPDSSALLSVTQPSKAALRVRQRVSAEGGGEAARSPG